MIGPNSRIRNFVGKKYAVAGEIAVIGITFGNDNECKWSFIRFQNMSKAIPFI